MEPLNFKKRIIGILLLIFCMGCVAGSFFLTAKSRIALNYPLQNKEEITFLILTRPAMKITASGEQAYIENIEIKTKKELTEDEYLDAVLSKIKLGRKDVKFFTPLEKSKDVFWLEWISEQDRWLYNPAVAFNYLYAYARAFYEHRTNVYPHEFLLLTLEMLDNNDLDYITKLEDVKAPKKMEAKSQGYSPLTADDRPLIVEILNASGKKGLALEATHFLRELNEKKLLYIDVLQYDNFSGTEDASKIIYYSDKEKEIRQLSSALRIKEIYKEKNPSVYSDAKIILGRDFTTPK